MIVIPFLPSNAVVTPLPGIGLPDNEPSYISLNPQDGLVDFPMNAVTPGSSAILRVSSAPLKNLSVTSCPFLLMTRVLLSSTASPVPLWVSWGPLGCSVHLIAQGIRELVLHEIGVR